jgi:S1-C subfamily serine protease
MVNETESGIYVANKNLPCVLELTCSFQASTSYATGFIIDESGYVLTNAHVVTDSASNRFVYEALQIKGKFYNSKEEYTLNIIDYDIDLDLALLKFEKNDLALKAVSVAASKDLPFGATVFTLGNAEGYGISMTKGIISAPLKNFKDTETGVVSQVIQIDAAVNSGSSGGPLLNIDGDVIGIISFKIKKNNNGSIIDGIGFAIPSEVFMLFIKNTLNKSDTTDFDGANAEEQSEDEEADEQELDMAA